MSPVPPPASAVTRVAAIGLGWVALNRHIPSIRRTPGLRLVGVIDRQPGKAAAVAQKLDLPRHAETADLSAVPWLDEIDAIVIGAAPMAHADLALAALAAGKHVLTEKPFAMNVAQGESMVAAAKANNRILAVVHNFQFSRAAHKLAHDRVAGHLGAIRSIAAVQLGNPRRRLPAWFEQLPFGLFYDESPHFFYLVRDLAGGSLTLQHAYGVADPNGAKTPAQIALLYRNAANIPITIDCDFNSAVSEWHILVTGDRALGILDIFRDIYIRLPNDGAHALPGILNTSLSAIGQHVLQHIPNGLAWLRNRLDYGNDEVFTRFAAATRSLQPPNGISADDALAILKLQHEATAAIQQSLFA